MISFSILDRISIQYQMRIVFISVLNTFYAIVFYKNSRFEFVIHKCLLHRCVYGIKHENTRYTQVGREKRSKHPYATKSTE